ncbi:hypothetical protein Tco_0370240 [Tanacetum coccineum]
MRSGPLSVTLECAKASSKTRALLIQDRHLIVIPVHRVSCALNCSKLKSPYVAPSRVTGATSSAVLSPGSTPFGLGISSLRSDWCTDGVIVTRLLIYPWQALKPGCTHMIEAYHHGVKLILGSGDDVCGYNINTPEQRRSSAVVGDNEISGEGVVVGTGSSASSASVSSAEGT